METLQGLATYLEVANERVACPFTAMGSAGRYVAAAFADANAIAEVWAALRCLRRLGHGDYTGYLMGCHLNYWHDRDYEIGELAFLDLRERAQEWMGRWV